MSAKSTDGFNQFPIPVGSVITYAGSIANGKLPPLYLLCDGTLLLISEYPELFSVIGTNFGVGTPTQFNLPNMTGRIASCDTLIGFGNAIPSSTAVTFAPITLDDADIPTLTGMAVNMNIAGNFEAGSSNSNEQQLNENLLGGRFPMRSSTIATVQSVNVVENAPPVFDYTNGTGIVAPVNFTLVGANDFVVQNVAMTYLIKAKSGFF